MQSTFFLPPLKNLPKSQEKVSRRSTEVLVRGLIFFRKEAIFVLFSDLRYAASLEEVRHLRAELSAELDAPELLPSFAGII